MLGLFHCPTEDRFDLLLDENGFGVVGIRIIQLRPFKFLLRKRHLLLRSQYRDTVEDVLDLGLKDLNSEVFQLKNGYQFSSITEVPPPRD